jgi:hypothetical protein
VQGILTNVVIHNLRSNSKLEQVIKSNPQKVILMMIMMICSVFNDAVSSSDYIVSNDTMINE